MKTPRFQISIVMAAAIGTIVLILSSTHADPLKGFGRLRTSERDATSLSSRTLKQAKCIMPLRWRLCLHGILVIGSSTWARSADQTPAYGATRRS